MVHVFSRFAHRLPVIAALVLFTATPSLAAGEREVQDQLAARIGAVDAGAETDRLAAIRDVYASRDFRLVWSDGRKPGPRATEALGILGRADIEGLEPQDYAAPAGHHAPAFANATDAARFDISLSNTMLKFLGDLRNGRVAPGQIEPDLKVSHPTIDMRAALERLAGEADLRAVVEAYVSRNPVYRNLRGSLAAYRRLAEQGGWRPVPDGPKLVAPETGERVTALRARLQATKDLIEPANGSDAFDDDLEKAVKAFQKRHGLDPDGVAGTATFAALNVPVEDRIEQIKLNMERWRWMPDDLGARHILVNIAAFELHGVVDGSIRKRMRVVVGRDYRRTPIFSDAIRYLEVNPYWHVPPKIAVEDLLPKIRKDPAYLTNEGFTVLDGWGADARPVNASQVNWASLGKGSFPYKLRQDPGPRNALGRIKFMFPNAHDVYLHDSPARELFRKNVRTFSSGCIRVEDAVGLAGFLLGLQADPAPDRVKVALADKQTTIIPLRQPIPVHLTYFTAWSDEDGTVNFRRDIYERDASLAAALARRDS